MKKKWRPSLLILRKTSPFKMTESRRIVVNTGPLIALSGIERLDLLDALYDKVMVPRQVHDEILQGGAIGKDTSVYLGAGFLQKTQLSIPIDPILSATLDKGEAAVIQLARQEKIERILIDERKARKIARNIYGLSVFGTMRLLLDAKHAGLLKNISDLIDKMRNRGYWIHQSIVEVALREAGEK
jgi:predicted nucleic acid-binding protein